MYKAFSHFLAVTLGKLQQLMRNLSEPVEALPPDGEINTVIVHAFSLGSALAFRHIYDRFAPAIYRVSVRYLRSEQLAEDVVQKVFSEFWFRREKFSDVEEVRLFLMTKAKSEAMNSIRKIHPDSAEPLKKG